ncbi:MAG: DUF2946 family protein [Burkholderiales bacterium]|nr:DUF2946 family protein [Burkholderiales bacterium]
MSSTVLHQLRSVTRPLGRMAALWLLVFALLPLARATAVPDQNPALGWDQVCVASVDGVSHATSAGVDQAGDPTGYLAHMGPDCQLCPQCVLGNFALPNADRGLATLRPTSHARIRSTFAAPAKRPARHGAQPRAPPLV